MVVLLVMVEVVIMVEVVTCTHMVDTSGAQYTLILILNNTQNATLPKSAII